MSYVLEVVFPSNTNQQLACEALTNVSAEYEIKDDKLIFKEDLSYEENEIVHNFSGEVKKCSID